MNDAAGETGEGSGDDVSPDDLLKQLSGKVLTVLFSAAGFLGFVAVAGGVTVWFHFYTAQLPAVKAIEEMPRSQLLVNGAVPLIIFGVLGLVAVAVCYAIDPGGRAREGIVHSLIVLFGAAAVFVVLAAPVGLSHELWLLALITAGVVVAIAASYLLKEKEDVEKLEKLRTETAGEEPDRFKPTLRLLLLLLALVVVVTGVAWGASGKWWVPLAILTGAALAVMNFRIAEGTGTRFTTFGLGVFFSLPLFGAIVGLLILADQPLVQPAAVIRSTDEGRLVIEGIYITDNGSDVFLGSVATDGCGSSELRRGSGSIFAIPKDEVLAMRIGRVQSIGDALQNAPALAELLIRNAGAFPEPPKKRQARVTTDREAGSQSTDQSAAPAEQATGTKQATRMWPLRHTRDQAVREEPDPDPTPQIEGGVITVNGDGFGDTQGRLLVGGRRARVQTWDDDKIVAKAPANAKTSRVVVRCPRVGLVLGAPAG